MWLAAPVVWVQPSQGVWQDRAALIGRAPKVKCQAFCFRSCNRVQWENSWPIILVAWPSILSIQPFLVFSCSGSKCSTTCQVDGSWCHDPKTSSLKKGSSLWVGIMIVAKRWSTNSRRPWQKKTKGLGCRWSFQVGVQALFESVDLADQAQAGRSQGIGGMARAAIFRSTGSARVWEIEQCIAWCWQQALLPWIRERTDWFELSWELEGDPRNGTNRSIDPCERWGNLWRSWDALWPQLPLTFQHGREMSKRGELKPFWRSCVSCILLLVALSNLEIHGYPWVPTWSKTQHFLRRQVCRLMKNLEKGGTPEDPSKVPRSVYSSGPADLRYFQDFFAPFSTKYLNLRKKGQMILFWSQGLSNLIGDARCIRGPVVWQFSSSWRTAIGLRCLGCCLAFGVGWHGGEL